MLRVGGVDKKMNAHLRVVAVGMLEHLVSDNRCRRALVVGVGGGGDVVSTLHIALRVQASLSVLNAFNYFW